MTVLLLRFRHDPWPSLRWWSAGLPVGPLL